MPHCYKMRLFPLVLAVWNIERHNAFAQSIQGLLRELPSSKILIVFFFFSAIWPMAEWKHDSIISWPALGLIWWTHSECIWWTDIFSPLQKAGLTFKYKSSIVKAESQFKKTTVGRIKEHCGVKRTRASRVRQICL